MIYYIEKTNVIIRYYCDGLGLVGYDNYTTFDTTYIYYKIIIYIPNADYIEIEIDECCDYSGEQLQVKVKDGTVYRTSSFNCVLINWINSFIFTIIYIRS